MYISNDKNRYSWCQQAPRRDTLPLWLLWPWAKHTHLQLALPPLTCMSHAFKLDRSVWK